MKNLFRVESTAKDLESTLAEYVSIQTGELRADSNFPASLDPSQYESKAAEAINEILRKVNSITSENLTSVYDQCKEIYKEYLIALADDVKTNVIEDINIDNVIGDAMDKKVSENDFDKFKALNSAFTKELKGWTSQMIYFIKIQKNGYQALKEFILKRVVNFLEGDSKDVQNLLAVAVPFNNIYIKSKFSGEEVSNYEGKGAKPSSSNERLQRDEKDEYLNNLVVFKE